MTKKEKENKLRYQIHSHLPTEPFPHPCSVSMFIFVCGACGAEVFIRTNEQLGGRTIGPMNGPPRNAPRLTGEGKEGEGVFSLLTGINASRNNFSCSTFKAGLFKRIVAEFAVSVSCCKSMLVVCMHDDYFLLLLLLVLHSSRDVCCCSGLRKVTFNCT